MYHFSRSQTSRSYIEFKKTASWLGREGTDASSALVFIPFSSRSCEPGILIHCRTESAPRHFSDASSLLQQEHRARRIETVVWFETEARSTFRLDASTSFLPFLFPSPLCVSDIFWAPSKGSFINGFGHHSPSLQNFRAHPFHRPKTRHAQKRSERRPQFQPHPFLPSPPTPTPQKTPSLSYLLRLWLPLSSSLSFFSLLR